jgi:hypothetical protein
MIIKKVYSRDEVIEELKQLVDIMESKAIIDEHNEWGTEMSGYESMENVVERYTTNGEFNTELWIKENLK